MPSHAETELRSRACPDCYLCDTAGKELYRGLRDRFFGAPGQWTLKQCTNAACELIWLDPMPLEEDIGVAYRTYYTHETGNSKKQFRPLGSVYRAARSMVARTSGLGEVQKELEHRYLGNRAPGHLLEVGCGAGEYLALMRSRGWAVQGVEVDARACESAASRFGLAVRKGTLVECRFADASFDAIVMNHVIEHLFNPVQVLQECHRILKPGGALVVITPNSGGMGHARFRENWRDLDPPRHIHIFSMKSLHACAARAGFDAISTGTTPAHADIIFEGSTDIQIDGRHNMERSNAAFFERIRRKSFAALAQLHQFRRWKSDASVGEEAVLECHKQL